MIVAVCKDIVETKLRIPFGHGRKPMLNLFDGKDNPFPKYDSFVWLYPFPEGDEQTGGTSLRTSFDIILGFNIVGELEPGTEIEQSYIDRARELAYKFEIELMRTADLISKVANVKREPFYNFMAENLYGMNVRLTATSRFPVVKC